MNRSEVQAWLDTYIEAWRTNQAGLVEALFSEDAVYRYRPYAGSKVLEGRDEVVRGWLEQNDEPETWEASYQVFAVDGDRAVATGISLYFATEEEPEKVYHNCFLLSFDPVGRCTEFTEFWMLEPQEGI